jgi:peptidoglycan glycosyltransferase
MSARRQAGGGGMSRRSSELLLLLAATPVVLLLFVLAVLGEGLEMSLATFAVPCGLFAAFLMAHVAVRLLAPAADPALLPITFVLSGTGIAFVMRLAPGLAMRQTVWLFCAVAAMILVLVVLRNPRKLGDYKYSALVAGLVLLLLPALAGVDINGSRIWLSFAGFSFQPGELSKILIVLFLAGFLAHNREMLSVSGRRIGRLHIPDFGTLVPLVMMWGVSLLIVIFERDLGSALLFFGIFVIMLYVATGRVAFVAIAAVLGAVGAVAAYSLFGHVQARVAVWIDPFAYAQTIGYQLVQSLYSLADGSLFGTGIGQGLSDSITFVESDFIFIAIAEETGLLGASGVLILFVLFLTRGLTIASRAKTDMEAFTATGLTAAITFQAFVIVAGVTRLIPMTGVTLPFMSQGGSSLLASFIIVGMLLRVSAADVPEGAGDAPGELRMSLMDGGVLGRIALGKRLTALIAAFCLIFATMIGNLTWEMVFNAPTILAMPSNSHQLAREASSPRGVIVTSDGVILAQSALAGDGAYRREYPQGQLAAHVVGYASPRYGMTGVEATALETLRGKKDFNSWSDALASAAGAVVAGNDVVLTIDSRIQLKAEEALTGHDGAAVVLDAKTGAVLAAASAPAFDPNNIDELLAAASDDKSDSRLVNRATQSLYAPGSTFKTVTLTGALRYSGVQATDSYEAPGVMKIGNADVRNFDGASYGTLSVKRAFEISSNTVFGQIAAKMGASVLVATAESFGFNHSIGQDFDVAVSLMPRPADMTEWELAWSGIGQPVGEHASSPAGPQATVVQMALVAAAMANGGTVMNPYVIERSRTAEGLPLASTSPQELGTVAPASIVAQVSEAMAGVVATGTGTKAQIDGHQVFGKTGTAETGAPMDDSWFIGYVQAGQRTVVVAIVLERTPSGAATEPAADILRRAIEVFE